MSAAALTLPPEQVVWRPKVNPWAIAATVSMAAFIEVLDTSVANVALPYVAGGLGASYDDSTWVLTSYLAANAIVLPISGWLAELIGRKRYFMMSLAIFTVSSLLCGLAPNLPLLLLFRAVQGIGGGGLQPMAQAILNDTFPPEQRGSAFAVYGITAVLAPTVGPMLGGWITDNYSWRWIFFITLPPVLLALYLTHTLVEDPPFLRRIKRGGIRVDYIGISMLTLGVGSLQVVLDKGQEDDWFGSHFIATLAITATVCLISLVIWEWFRKEPIIDVRMFKSFNFAAANLMMFMMGFMLFSTLVLIPEFLQTLMGYTAELAGLVLSGGGVILLVMMPIVGRLTSKIQARWLIATGWLCLAIGLFYCANQIDLFVSFKFAMWLRVAQVVGIGFLFVPITAAGYIGVPPEKGNSVSGIDQFHAQYRRQYRNFRRDHDDCPSGPISPANSRRPHHSRFACISFGTPCTELEDRALRASGRGRSRPGNCEVLRIGASTRRRTVLYGHLLGFGRALLRHVRSCVFPEEE